MSFAAFISFSYEDATVARALADKIENVGLPVWMSAARPDGGVIDRDIADGIRQSACLLLVLTPRAARSRWVADELDFARNNNIPIIPLLFEDVEQSEGIFLTIGRLARQDVRRGLEDDAFKRVVENVRARYSRLCPVVAVMNMKGGVGKTTLTANIFGSAFKELRKKVLLIDMDPQANLSQLLVHQAQQSAAIDLDESVISAFEPGRPVGARSPASELTTIGNVTGAPVDPKRIAHQLAVSPRGEYFDLIIGQFEIAKYTLPQNSNKMDKCLDYFQQFIDIARRHYDVIALDVSPASSHLTLAAMRAATAVLAPVRPDKYSYRGLRAIKRMIDELFELKSHPQFYAIMNAIDRDTDPEVENDIRNDKEFGSQLFETRIPVSRYFWARHSLVARDPYSRLAINAQYFNSAEIKRVLKNAAAELLERVEDAGPKSRDASSAGALDKTLQ